MKTAVSEAVTNAIIHGYEQRVEKVNKAVVRDFSAAATSDSVAFGFAIRLSTHGAVPTM